MSLESDSADVPTAKGTVLGTYHLAISLPGTLEEDGPLASRKPALIGFLAGDQPVKIFRAFLLVCGNPALQDDFTDLGNTPGFLCRNRLKALLQFGLDPKG